MNLKEKLKERLDVDKNGKVSLDDAVLEAYTHFGEAKVKYGTIGFIVGVLVTFVLLKIIGK